MPKQIIGHYRPQKEKLLKEFDVISRLLTSGLKAQYDEEFARRLHQEARQEYEKLIPDIPYIKGQRGKALNIFLLATAQELALYKAMNALGKSAEEAWELCHRAVRLYAGRIPGWKKWLMRRLMFSRLVRKIFARRARRGERGRFGDFEIEYLAGDGSEFDIGVNYHTCGNLQFAKDHGGEAFAPYICMSDIALSDALGWGLIRTQTLADGCDHCDFRFKKGGATRVSSKTPAVQATIDKIQRDEAGRGDEANIER